MQQGLRTFFWIAAIVAVVFAFGSLLGLPKGMPLSVLLGAVLPGLFAAVALLWMGEVIGTLGDIARSLAAAGSETQSVPHKWESVAPEAAVANLPLRKPKRTQ